MALASTVDVEARLPRPLTAGEKRVVPTLLDDVELQIERTIPDLVGADVAMVRHIEAWAVARALRAAETDEVSRQGLLEEPPLVPKPWITPKEWSLLGGGLRASSVSPFLESPPLYIVAET